MIRCSKCVMPQTWPGITFDKDGVCNICLEYDKQNNIDWAKRQEQLAIILNQYRNYALSKNVKWDCVVGLSGGKDSVYTLWAMKNKYHMTPLAVTYEHGLPLGDEGEWNLRELPSKLGIDHILFRGDQILRNKISCRSTEIMGDFCGFCHTGVGAFHAWIAKGFNIPLTVWGEPTSLYQTTGSSYSVDKPEEQNKEHYEKVFCGNRIKELTPEGYTERDMQPHTWPSGYFPLKAIYLGNYEPWNQREHVDIIKKLGWQEPFPPNYSWIGWDKADCVMGESVREYQKYIKLGFGKASFQASKDIREGRMTRDAGLKMIEIYEGKKPNDLGRLLGGLGTTEEEFTAATLKHKK